MKILLVNDNGNHSGGTEKYLFNLISELKKKDKVRLFSIGSSKNDSGIKLIKKFRIYSDQIFNVDSYKKMKKELQAFDPDLVHIHNIDKKISASFLPLLKNIPTIMTIHDLDLINPGAEYLSVHDCKMVHGKYCDKCTSRKSYILFKIKNFVRIPSIKKNIDLFIAPSKYILNRVHQDLGINNIVQLNHGINLYKFTSLNNLNQLVFVGRLEKMKGIFPLIHAFDKINKLYPNIELVIVGDGKEKNNLTALVKKLKLKNVKFTGWVNDKDLSQIYINSSVIIYPSICEESFGLVGIEAMSIGRPVIASRVGGIPEWLEDEHTGYLVDAGNSNQIADKVIKLLSDKKLLTQMGINAHLKAEQFTLKEHISKLKIIYKQVIKEKNL